MPLCVMGGGWTAAAGPPPPPRAPRSARARPTPTDRRAAAIARNASTYSERAWRVSSSSMDSDRDNRVSAMSSFFCCFFFVIGPGRYSPVSMMRAIVEGRKGWKCATAATFDHVFFRRVSSWLRTLDSYYRVVHAPRAESNVRTAGARIDVRRTLRPWFGICGLVRVEDVLLQHITHPAMPRGTAIT